ncbi:hypothetical protein MNBD_ALPHA08-1463 [hydrothermal vent metagenome]|uniref:Outer membrane lipoprotein carrier protein LolA n=1 Tax=hydrothermal vent metagenome TaxID=652676 RepID=A0A3B0RPP6_9ZZZZ
MKKKLLKRFLSVSAICLLGISAILPATTSPASAQTRLTQPQLAAVNEIARYFNSIRSMKGQFTQTGPRGRVSSGVFYIVKPGRMRFEYAPPNPLLVVSDGSWLYVKNRKRNRVDHYPLTTTPLRLILDQKVNLFKETKIQSVSETDELTTVMLKDTSAFASGSLVLVFDKINRVLQQWVVIDERGRRTTVSLSNIENDIRANPKLFVMKLPRSNLRDAEDDR